MAVENRVLVEGLVAGGVACRRGRCFGGSRRDRYADHWVAAPEAGLVPAGVLGFALAREIVVLRLSPSDRFQSGSPRLAVPVCTAVAPGCGRAASRAPRVNVAPGCRRRGRVTLFGYCLALLLLHHDQNFFQLAQVWRRA